MALATIAGSSPGGSLTAPVGPNGLIGVTSGSPITADEFNADLADLQGPTSFINLAGVLTGGPCTAIALNVTIPSGFAYYAKVIWQSSAAIVIGVANAATTYLWGCSDGIIRPTPTNVLPTGFDALSACLLVKATAVAGAVTLDNSVRQQARYADPVARVVNDGPLSLDYALNVIDTSAAALKVPAATADPAVPSVGVFVWYRTDTHQLCVSESGSIKRSGPFS